MSTLKIEERITVPAPPARVWTFLLDPARVASCLPGARFDGNDGDNTFLGTMKVKVGPVTMEFKGKATLSEIVEAEHRVTMTGTGNDKSGGGSAKMDMKSRILAGPDGGSEIIVEADVDLAGKLVRFGRGMMEGISKQLFKQFAERVQAELASEAEEEKQEEPAKEEAAAAPSEAEAKKEEAAPAKEEAKQEEAAAPEAKKEEVGAAPEAKSEEAATASEAEAKKEEAAAAPEAKAEEAATSADEAKAEESAPEPKEAAPAKEEAAPAKKDDDAPPAKKTAPAAKKAAPLAKEPEALDAGSLVWAALWAWIKGLLARIFGRRQ
jgi:carbon monoxide dehydrogenase subunit G